jgi:hypothetical protein
MKVWITKYALTSGIFEVDAETCTSPSLIAVRKPGELTAYFHNNDWHKSKEDAIARAEEMRAKKIASLRKSIAKLEAMSFDSVRTEPINDGGQR